MRKTMATSEPIVLGKVGENEVNKVLFPVRGWKELYGDGQFGLIVQLPGENDPYPAPVEVPDTDYCLNGEFVEWVVNLSDVSIAGRGKCELRYSVEIPDTTPTEYKRVKSVVYETIIWDALGTNSLEPPEPWQPWIDDVEDKAVRAENAAEDAETAQGLAEDAQDAAEDARDDARDARDAAEGYASDAHDAQIAAEGAAADADRYADAALESARNAATEVSTAFGQITATAATLSPGSSATASFDTSSKVLSLGIPKGEKGDQGLPGSDGVFWLVYNSTTKAEIDAAVSAGKILMYKNGSHYLRASGYTLYTSSVPTESGKIYLFESVEESSGVRTIYSQSVDVKDNGTITYGNLESMSVQQRGKITVSGTDYTPTRKPLAITENGVTTTYYVADIT